MIPQIKQRFAKHFLDILVLTTVQSHPTWGYKLISQIGREYGVKIGYGKMYPLLNSMEERGLIKSRIETIKGRKRKIYEATSTGLELIMAYHEFLKEQLQISGSEEIF